jgi:hypothetical protein
MTKNHVKTEGKPILQTAYNEHFLDNGQCIK